jgi:hypothetical protein
MERFMMKQAADVFTIVTHKRHSNKIAVRPSNECPREPHCRQIFSLWGGTCTEASYSILTMYPPNLTFRKLSFCLNGDIKVFFSPALKRHSHIT